jgi:hypothetical protein
MKIFQILVFLFIINFVATNINGQKINEFKIISTKSKEPIAKATIYLPVQGFFKITDENGIVKLSEIVSPTDSIIITHVNYYESRQIIGTNLENLFYLEPKVVELENVNVLPAHIVLLNSLSKDLSIYSSTIVGQADYFEISYLPDYLNNAAYARGYWISQGNLDMPKSQHWKEWGATDGNLWKQMANTGVTKYVYNTGRKRDILRIWKIYRFKRFLSEWNELFNYKKIKTQFKIIYDTSSNNSDFIRIAAVPLNQKKQKGLLTYLINPFSHTMAGVEFANWDLFKEIQFAERGLQPSPGEIISTKHTAMFNSIGYSKGNYIYPFLLTCQYNYKNGFVEYMQLQATDYVEYNLRFKNPHNDFATLATYGSLPFATSTNTSEMQEKLKMEVGKHLPSITENELENKMNNYFWLPKSDFGADSNFLNYGNGVKKIIDTIKIF